MEIWKIKYDTHDTPIAKFHTLIWQFSLNMKLTSHLLHVNGSISFSPCAITVNLVYFFGQTWIGFMFKARYGVYGVWLKEFIFPSNLISSNSYFESNIFGSKLEMGIGSLRSRGMLSPIPVPIPERVLFCFLIPAPEMGNGDPGDSNFFY